jgi:hypothetical protein
MIASLVYAGARLDRDENHVNETILSEKKTLCSFSHQHFMKNFLIVYQLFLSIKLDNYHLPLPIKFMQIQDCKINKTYLNLGFFYFLFARIYEAKSMVCLEVMQVFIMCPLFYSLIDNSSIFSLKILFKSSALVLFRCEFDF